MCTLRHEDAVRIRRFAELAESARTDRLSARERGDARAMMDAAIRWERAENCIGEIAN
jgi:hypothetical protein